MKTYNLKNIISSLFMCISFISCEHVLEIDSPRNEMVTDQVFQDVHTANAALENLYFQLWNNSVVSGGSYGMGAILGSYTDDLDCFSLTTGGALELYLNQTIASNPLVERFWNSSYQIIYASNLILEKIDGANAISQAERRRIKGEALTVRSMLYFYLQQLFDEVPYLVSTDYVTNSTTGKKNREELLNFLERDLEVAVALLNDSYRNTKRIYLNKKAAQLMLAKVYLLHGNWSKAEALCREILQSPLYQFENNLSKVFKNNGKHIIWQLSPKNAGDSTPEASLYYFINAAPKSYAISHHLYQQFETDDQRRDLWMTAVVAFGQTWYRPSKYKSMTGNNDESSVMMRLEEVYFTIAESLARQNKFSEGLNYLNYTRQRAGLSPLNSVTSEAGFIDELLQEKRREFFSEFGMRFFDLKRLNRLADLLSVKPNWRSYHAALPIPQKELTLNPNLNPQNPGY